MTEPDLTTKYLTAFPKLDNEQLRAVAEFAKRMTYVDSSASLLWVIVRNGRKRLPASRL